MNLNEALLQLKENLTDIQSNRINVHYTNIVALYHILEDRKLKGKWEYEYPSITSTAESLKRKKKSFTELATTRDAKLNDKSKMGLSGNADNVKITLYTDRIRSSVRNVKVEPIAEVPKLSEHEMIKLKSELKSKYGLDMPEELFSRFSSRAGKISSDERYNLIQKWAESKGFKGKKLSDIIWCVGSYLSEKETEMIYRKKREREERFVFPGVEGGVPVDSRLMKIEFDGPSISDDIIYFIDQENIDFGRLIKLLYESDIVRNKNFDSVIKQLRTEMKKREEKQ